MGDMVEMRIEVAKDCLENFSRHLGIRRFSCEPRKLNRETQEFSLEALRFSPEIGRFSLEARTLRHATSSFRSEF